MISTVDGGPGERGGVVARPDLVARLSGSRAPLAVMKAPAGYGKSTLARMWSEHDRRRSVMISVREHDAPVVTAATFLHRSDPSVLILDDVERLRDEAWNDVHALLDAMPEGSTLGLVGRRMPLGPFARLRSLGGVTSIGVRDLRMDRNQVDELARLLGFVLDPDLAERLMRRTEGWPAAIVLALLSTADDPEPFDEYVNAEVIGPLTPPERRFIARSSVLEWISPELCDAALQSASSARTIAALRSSGLPLFPLEGRRWRLHPVVREVLRSQLEVDEPEAPIGIAERGSAWCERNGFIDAAISMAQASGDVDRVAALTARSATTGSWAASQTAKTPFHFGLETSSQLVMSW